MAINTPSNEQKPVLSHHWGIGIVSGSRKASCVCLGDSMRTSLPLRSGGGGRLTMDVQACVIMFQILSCPVVKMVLAGDFLARAISLLNLAHGKRGVVIHLHYAIAMTQESRSGLAS